MRPTTVGDLVNAVRSQLNEDNRYAVNTATDILPALNRAQSYVTEIYGRAYPDALLRPYEAKFVSGQRDYDLPEGIFGNRIVRMEIVIPFSGSVPVPRVSAYEQSKFEASITIQNPIPSAYLVHQRQVRFLPTPSGDYIYRIWATQSPEPMVLDWGRITGPVDPVTGLLKTDSQYLLVDNMGGADSDAGIPSVMSDELQSFVSVVDAQTGAVKCTLQAQEIVDNQVVFSVVPSRSTVWNEPISGTLAPTVELDDYICTVAGTCIPMLDGVAINFMIQYAVEEMRRRLGDDSAVLEKQVLDEFEKQVKSTWAGRDQATRLNKKSRFLASPRYWRR